MFDAMRWAYTTDIENAGAKFVLVVLAEHASNERDDDDWVCKPGLDRIANFTAQGYRTVQRHIKALEDDGYISTERRVRKDGTKGGFLFTLHKARNPDYRTKRLGEPAAKNDARQNGQTENHAPKTAAPLAKSDAGTCQIGQAEGLSEGYLEAEESSLRSESGGAPPPADRFDDLGGDGYGDEAPKAIEAEVVGDQQVRVPDADPFDRWWASYPKKTGKPASRVEWAKVVKAGVDVEMLIRRVEDYAEAVSAWPSSARKFIIWPERWLKYGRWEDDMEEIRAAHAPDDLGKRGEDLRQLAVAQNALAEMDGSACGDWE